MIEFAVDASYLESRDGGPAKGSELVDAALAAEAAGMSHMLIADGSGDSSAIASYIFHATATLGIQVELRAGVLQPETAARQLATLDHLSGGRVGVHMTVGENLSHEEGLAGLDEYVMLLKRLWSNDKPIDHEGSFHRVKAGFSGVKPFNGMVPIMLAGISGVSIKVAARHADTFLLPSATVEEAARMIERVKAAAASHRHADAIRFALPVRKSTNDRPGMGAVSIPAVPEKAARLLLRYSQVGVTDFIVTGLRTASEISVFGHTTAALVRHAHQDAGSVEEIQPAANVLVTRWGHYPA